MRKSWLVYICLAVIVISLAGCFPLSGVDLIWILADEFFSNGHYINGWYWLRDPAFDHRAEWVFQGVPLGEEDLVLELEVLATDRVDGPSGVDARFFVSYGISPWGDQGGLIVGTQEVILPNVSPPGDPVGYTCRGQINISREHISETTMIWIRAHRSFVLGQGDSGESVVRRPARVSVDIPGPVHVAFRKESVILIVSGERIVYRPT